MSKAMTDYLNQEDFYEKLRATPFGRSNVGGTILDGGLMMWPLLVAMIVAIVIVIERFLSLWRPRISCTPMLAHVQKALHAEGLEAALHSCEKCRGPFARILHSGLTSAPSGQEAVNKAVETTSAVQMPYFYRGLTVLATITVIAPLMGFIGSLSGLTATVYSLTDPLHISSRLVSAGLTEAVNTTVTGLLIAIPAALLYRLFMARANRFVSEIEVAKATLLKEIGDFSRQRAAGERAAR
jgi:biopolymer transport protein ExbB